MGGVRGNRQSVLQPLPMFSLDDELVVPYEGIIEWPTTTDCSRLKNAAILQFLLNRRG